MKLIVLDYCTSAVDVYTLPSVSSVFVYSEEFISSFIESKGHRFENCCYMISEDMRVEFHD